MRIKTNHKLTHKNWGANFDRLPERFRSVLLVFGFLGNQVDLKRLCRLATPSREQCLSCVAEMHQMGILTKSGSLYSLNFPPEIVETRITPRIRRLFEQRDRCPFQLSTEGGAELYEMAAQAAEWFENPS